MAKIIRKADTQTIRKSGWRRKFANTLLEIVKNEDALFPYTDRELAEIAAEKMADGSIDDNVIYSYRQILGIPVRRTRREQKSKGAK